MKSRIRLAIGLLVLMLLLASVWIITESRDRSVLRVVNDTVISVLPATTEPDYRFSIRFENTGANAIAVSGKQSHMRACFVAKRLDVPAGQIGEMDVAIKSDAVPRDRFGSFSFVFATSDPCTPLITAKLCLRSNINEAHAISPTDR